MMIMMMIIDKNVIFNSATIIVTSRYVPTVCAKTLCRYCKIKASYDRKQNRLKKSLWFMYYAYQSDFLNDQLLKKSKLFIAKMKKKNFRFEKN